MENFKSFGQNVEIPMAPITLILGQNSAGKSSILQALYLLKQSYEVPHQSANDTLKPRVERGIVDFGSIPELLFDHDTSRTLKIRVLFDKEGHADESIFPTLEELMEPGKSPPTRKTMGVGMHFGYSTSEKITSLCQLEVFNHNGEKIACFASQSDISDTVIKKENDYIRRTGKFPYNANHVLQNMLVTDSEEFWEDSFKSAKNARDKILARLNSELAALDTVDVPETTHLEKVLDRFIDAKEDGTPHPRRILKKIALRKAIDFYDADFSLSDFISRMQAEQYGDMVAYDKGMLNLTNLGGAFPGRFPERPERSLSESLGEDIAQYIRGVSDISSITLDFTAKLGGLLRHILPLGPYRNPPDRWYIYAGTPPGNAGYSGGNLPDLLYKRKELVDKTNDWLHKMGVEYEMKVEPASARYTDLYEIRFIDKQRRDPVDVSLKDIGFGICQILPVVVECAKAESQIILIEQPEVHIHPRLQANLGDLFAESIDRNNQLIIETHSEHLVLRLQKLIRTGKLKADDVSALSVSRRPQGSHVRQIRLDNDGEFIDDWPGGFFPERLKELV